MIVPLVSDTTVNGIITRHKERGGSGDEVLSWTLVLDVNQKINSTEKPKRIRL